MPLVQQMNIAKKCAPYLKDSESENGASMGLYTKTNESEDMAQLL